MRAVIYTRVSNDDSGRSTSTQDQEKECRAICESRGWDVAKVLCDKDIGASRWSGKDRPAYAQLNQTLRAGDVLVTWEASRAQRDLEAYVVLRELCATRGVQWCYNGRVYDLTDGDDRFSTGLDALLAEKEAEQIRARVLRGKLAAAEAGKPAGRAPFGLRAVRDPDTGRTITWEPHPDQAPLIIEAVDRILAGETIYRVCADFTNRGEIGPTHGEWVPRRLKGVLVTPSLAGYRVHRGVIIGNGNWDPLIDRARWHRLHSLLTDPARRTVADVTLKHLLTGIAVCDICGTGVRYFDPPTSRSASYQCPKNHVRRSAQLVDELVVQSLLVGLESADPGLFEADDTHDDAVDAEIAELRMRLDGYVDAAADGKITPEAFAKIESRLIPKITAAEGRRSKPVEPLAAAMGTNPREVWATLDIASRRRVVKALLDIRILKASARGPKVFNPDDIEVRWRIGAT